MNLKALLIFALFIGSAHETFCQMQKQSDSTQKMAIYRFCAQCKQDKKDKEILLLSDGTSIDVGEKIDARDINPDIEDTSRVVHFMKVFAHMDKLGYELISTSTDTDIVTLANTIMGVKNITYFYFRRKPVKK